MKTYESIWTTHMSKKKSIETISNNQIILWFVKRRKIQRKRKNSTDEKRRKWSTSKKIQIVDVANNKNDRWRSFFEQTLFQPKNFSFRQKSDELWNEKKTQIELRKFLFFVILWNISFWYFRFFSNDSKIFFTSNFWHKCKTFLEIKKTQKRIR